MAMSPWNLFSNLFLAVSELCWKISFIYYSSIFDHVEKLRSIVAVALYFSYSETSRGLDVQLNEVTVTDNGVLMFLHEFVIAGLRGGQICGFRQWMN